jgi:hypothetical protein
MGETVRDQPAAVVGTRRDLVVVLAAVGYPDGGDERPRPHNSPPRIQQALNLIVGQRWQFHTLIVPGGTGRGRTLTIHREHTYA